MAAKSGQVTVTSAGTAVQGTDISFSANMDWIGLCAHPDNDGPCYFGNDGAGDVTNANGAPLEVGGGTKVVQTNNLNKLYFDADNNGDVVCWWQISI